MRLLLNIFKWIYGYFYFLLIGFHEAWVVGLTWTVRQCWLVYSILLVCTWYYRGTESIYTRDPECFVSLELQGRYNGVWFLDLKCWKTVLVSVALSTVQKQSSTHCTYLIDHYWSPLQLHLLYAEMYSACSSFFSPKVCCSRIALVHLVTKKELATPSYPCAHSLFLQFGENKAQGDTESKVKDKSLLSRVTHQS